MLELLSKYHPKSGASRPILIAHSLKVAEKAVAVARHLARREPVDVRFVEEAALLHDIGVHLTDAPEIGCTGIHPYLMHGILGREILEREGLPRHALVCERHIGVGLSREEIISQSLPLPPRDMLPLTIEERIVTYADLFFSKSDHPAHPERPIELVRERMLRHGSDKLRRLDAWHARFAVDS